ncbi:MAG TPA: SprT-like domain-containing protein [Bryobacteraceae bacterium]|nr:SprT-like domain-containing protein [Bryobacteraceae bacterium]
MQVERGQPRLPGFEEDSSPSTHPASVLLFESPIEIFRRVFAEVRPRTPLPDVAVEFCRFANANSFVRALAGRLEFRITDALQSAPAPILESLAYILICKLYRKTVPAPQRQRYNLYLNRQDVRRSLHLLRQTRGRKHISGPQGERYNLEEIFQQLNARFFDGLLAQPALGWSLRISKTILGHFDPSHNAIIISRLLDQPNAPPLAVEYVMYHEMLHLRYPVEAKGARRRIHPKEFRDAEKLFPDLKAAKAVLDKLCGAARRNDNAW